MANVVTEESLPFVESEQVDLTPEQEAEMEGASAQASSAQQFEEPYPHPFLEFAGRSESDLDAARVQDGQMGQMVTLGAFSHCKVDADPGAIEPGDLLTTAGLKGHAQKVLDPAKAAGAVVAKALGSLERGQGKIPVIVLMQ